MNHGLHRSSWVALTHPICGDIAPHQQSYRHARYDAIIGVHGRSFSFKDLMGTHSSRCSGAIVERASSQRVDHRGVCHQHSSGLGWPFWLQWASSPVSSFRWFISQMAWQAHAAGRADGDDRFELARSRGQGVERSLHHAASALQLWRFNCRLASTTSLVTMRKDLKREDKWKFIKTCLAKRIPVTPGFDMPKTLMTMKEGGFGHPRAEDPRAGERVARRTRGTSSRPALP